MLLLKFVLGSVMGLVVGFVAYNLPENFQVAYVGGMIVYISYLNCN